MVQDGVTSALGKAIKAKRNAMGWSQKEFAAKAGVYYQTVGNVENGKVRSSYKANKMCKALGTTLARLMREVADAHVAAGGRMYPDVGDLTHVLMEIRGMDESELATRMQVDLEDVQDVLGGVPVPTLWGAAAVALGVSPEAYDIAVVDGFEAALRYLDIPAFVDRPEGIRQPGG